MWTSSFTNTFQRKAMNHGVREKGGFHMSALWGCGTNMPTSPPKSGGAKINHSQKSLKYVHIYTVLGPVFPVACSNSFIPLISVWVLTCCELQTWLPCSLKQVLQAHATVSSNPAKHHPGKPWRNQAYASPPPSQTLTLLCPSILPCQETQGLWKGIHFKTCLTSV